MKTPLTLLCSLALIAGPLVAKEPVVFNELKLENGTVLKAATVLRVDPDGLHISHHEGVSKVKFENLPANVQEQFAFDREEAGKFREEKQAAQDARDAAERKERVESILNKKHAEQDEDVRRGREEFFALLSSGEYSYPQLEKILQDSIATLKETGRDDLAATLEDDRKLLRDREVTRPAESLRKERDQLAIRVRDLENQLALLNNKPQDDRRFSDVVWPIFVDRPVYIPQTVVGGHGHTPAGDCLPGTSGRPRLTPYSPNGVVPLAPASRPAAPIGPNNPGPGRFVQSPRMVQPAPAAPQPRNFVPPAAPQAPRVMSPQMPAGGAQVHGAHLWKKN